MVSYWHRTSYTVPMFEPGKGTRSVLAMIVPGATLGWTSIITGTPPAARLMYRPMYPPPARLVLASALVGGKKVVADELDRICLEISSACNEFTMYAVGESWTCAHTWSLILSR